jgi:hypothetical protein
MYTQGMICSAACAAVNVLGYCLHIETILAALMQLRGWGAQE